MIIPVVLAGTAAALICMAIDEVLPYGYLRRLASPGATKNRFLLALRWITSHIRSVPEVALEAEQRKLEAAGMPPTLGAREIYAIKGALIAAGLVIGLIVGFAGSFRTGLAIALLVGVTGLVLSEAYIARRLRVRGEVMAIELPDLLDLFRACIEAGMPTPTAMSTAAEQFSGPLADEMRRATAEQALGLNRQAVLAGLERRVAAAPEVSAFVRVVRQTEQRGVPVAEALANQAEGARAARRRHVQEKAAKAGPKIQLVVALVLVPAALLVVAAALITGLLSGSGPLVG